jgi:hypothetical protein
METLPGPGVRLVLGDSTEKVVNELRLSLDESEPILVLDQEQWLHDFRDNLDPGSDLLCHRPSRERVFSRATASAGGHGGQGGRCQSDTLFVSTSDYRGDHASSLTGAPKKTSASVRIACSADSASVSDMPISLRARSSL